MASKATVGRNVHYQAYGTPGGEYQPKPRAAIVTDEGDGETIGLCVLNPTGIFFNPAVPHAPNDVPTPGHWNWMPYQVQQQAKEEAAK